MSDLIVAVEKAALEHLKADASVTSVIPAAQLFSQDAPANPPKPFAKPGTPIARPFTGHRRRREIRFSWFIRADARFSGSAMIETARDHMGRCVGALVDSLYRARLPVEGGTARFMLNNDIRRQVDGEPDALEANIEFIVKVVAG